MLKKQLPLWRNWLARSAVNRKVAGSSPARGDHFFHFMVLYLLKNSQKSLEPDLNQWPMDSYYFNYSPPLYQLSYRGPLLFEPAGTVLIFIQKKRLQYNFKLYILHCVSGWPSGLRRCVQVAVYFCRRGFESHFWHVILLIMLSN